MGKTIYCYLYIAFGYVICRKYYIPDINSYNACFLGRALLLWLSVYALYGHVLVDGFQVPVNKVRH